MRMKQGPLCFAAASVMSAASLASQGHMTTMFGTARMRARSSTHWWVGPSSPLESPE